MKKVIIAQIVVLLAFLLVYTGLCNSFVYEHTLGLVAKTYHIVDGERKMLRAPFEQISSENYLHWDAVHYNRIREKGYAVDKGGSDFIFAFFPLFPYTWRLTHLPPFGILFFNYLLLSLAALLLLKIFLKEADLLRYLFLSLSLPGLAVFLIPYSEAVFILVASLGIYGFYRNRYLIFFTGFFLAALTRPAFTVILLAFAGTEIFFFAGHRKPGVFLKNTILRILPLLAGTVAVSVFQYANGSGGFFKFIEVQKGWGHVLGFPGKLTDWSQEGFAISIGVLFLIIIPALFLISWMFIRQIGNKNGRVKPDYTDRSDYLLILSGLYMIGMTLFIIFFQGGSLNGLFRYVLCTPFMLVMLFAANQRLALIPFKLRIWIFSGLFLAGIGLMSVVGYSRSWNFSDFGYFILAGVLGAWLLPEYRNSLFYRFTLAVLLLLNLVWTGFLINAYVIGGWIFT